MAVTETPLAQADIPTQPSKPKPKKLEFQQVGVAIPTLATGIHANEGTVLLVDASKAVQTVKQILEKDKERKDTIITNP